MDSFLLPELTDRVIAIPAQVRGIEEGRVVPVEIFRPHGCDPASMALEERSKHSSMLGEGLVVLGKEPLVVLLQTFP